MFELIGLGQWFRIATGALKPAAFRALPPGSVPTLEVRR
jgi:hypothetical protein